MVTQAEEQQTKEFLKRAEIRTMKKDLSKLREADALKERDKIAKIKPIEQQKAEQEAERLAQVEKAERQEVFQQNANQEKVAEKDLKKYATEEERQRIFLLESEHLDLEKQIDAIDKEKDPALKLEKNKLLIQERNQQEKLNAIVAQEKKLEDEEKFISEKAQTTTIPSEKKGLEQRRWDIEKEIQEVEKKRWAAEKEVEETQNNTRKVDLDLQKIVEERNVLNVKISEKNKSLREIFSAIMAREEEKIRMQNQERLAQQEVLSKARSEQREKVQREQWSNIIPTKPLKMKEGEGLKRKFNSVNLGGPTATEDEQRKQFLSDVENWSEDKDKQGPPVPKAPAQEMPPPPKK